MRNNRGYTLFEFVVAILLFIVLTAIALPNYVRYIKMIYYSEVVQVAVRYQDAVQACLLQQSGQFKKCNAGTHSIPKAILPGTVLGQVQSVEVRNAIITLTPSAENGILPTDTLILKPVYTNGTVTWKRSGGACERRLVDCY